MLIRTTRRDSQAFTADEIRAVTKTVFGDPVLVEVLPDGTKPEDYIYFGIQQIITPAQLDLIYDQESEVYNEKVTELKRGVLANLERIINKVIIDNEAKVQGKYDEGE